MKQSYKLMMMIGLGLAATQPVSAQSDFYRNASQNSIHQEIQSQIQLLLPEGIGLPQSHAFRTQQSFKPDSVLLFEFDFNLQGLDTTGSTRLRWHSNGFLEEATTYTRLADGTYQPAGYVALAYNANDQLISYEYKSLYLFAHHTLMRQAFDGEGRITSQIKYQRAGTNWAINEGDSIEYNVVGGQIQSMVHRKFNLATSGWNNYQRLTELDLDVQDVAQAFTRTDWDPQTMDWSAYEEKHMDLVWDFEKIPVTDYLISELKASFFGNLLPKSTYLFKYAPTAGLILANYANRTDTLARWWNTKQGGLITSLTSEYYDNSGWLPSARYLLAYDNQQRINKYSFQYYLQQQWQNGDYDTLAWNQEGYLNTHFAFQFDDSLQAWQRNFAYTYDYMYHGSQPLLPYYVVRNQNLAGTAFPELAQRFFFDGLSTSVTEKAAARLKLYPNPAQDFVTLEGIKEATKADLRIYDLNGRLLMHSAGQAVTGGLLHLNVQELPQGLYLLQVQSAHGMQWARFMKE